MVQEKIYNISFEKVYTLLIQKVQRKGKSKKEADDLIMWFTGYQDIDELCNSNISYGEFIDKASFNPACINIKGTICGVKIEEIEDPFMKKVRYLDKLIDELSKGKDVQKIINKYK